jgi:hypothetical protein
MSSVLLFGGRSLLDKPGVRESFLRIPEISAVLKQAQKELEFVSGTKIDLMSFATSEDNEFHSNTLWKDLVVQLFQVGLYKRMQKSLIKPKFIIGRSGGISAMDVCLGKQSLLDVLIAFQSEMEMQKEANQSQDILVGQKLELSKMYIYNGETYEEGIGGKSTQALLEEISKDNLITQIIALGISDTTVDPSSIFNVMNSIELDPLLSWFRAA